MNCGRRLQTSTQGGDRFSFVLSLRSAGVRLWPALCNGSHFGDGTALGLRRKAGHAVAVLRVLRGKMLFMFVHRQSSAMARCVSGMVL